MSRLALIVLCLAFGACRAPLTLSPDAVVLDVPSVRQKELDECGLVALEALAHYWGRAIPPAIDVELARSASEHHGVSGNELVSALERSGFEAYLFDGTLDESERSLLHHLDRGRPLLVMLVLGGDPHYVLVTGHDPANERLVLVDGRQGRAVMERVDFERAWDAAGRFTLLATPVERE
ncbi:MAG: hypothetical protein K8S98_08665 [Planctomycetes bacterium]|nr:hypothetical protein [Planctomycetota bacterium]